MSVTIKIVTCPQRAEMAETLKTALGLSNTDVICDDREGGGNPYYVYRKAFLTPKEPGETHRLVLNEDVEVCGNFKAIIEQITKAHPECAFSLFTPKLNSGYYDDFINNLKTPYLDYSGDMWGCAVLLPSDLIQECFAWIDANADPETVHDSLGTRDFLRYKGVQTLTTVPMLVQHIGDVSLYDPGLPIRKTTRFVDYPEDLADWTAAEVADIPALAWFAPKARSGSKAVSFVEATEILKGEK